jgi:hypothetical protein
MVKTPLEDGSPSSTAARAPAGRNAGAGPHLIAEASSAIGDRVLFWAEPIALKQQRNASASLNRFMAASRVNVSEKQVLKEGNVKFVPAHNILFQGVRERYIRTLRFPAI